MPIFDFKCEACGYSKELLRKISDSIVTECPECHKETFKNKSQRLAFNSQVLDGMSQILKIILKMVQRLTPKLKPKKMRAHLRLRINLHYA